RSMSQYLEYYLSKINGVDEQITINKGVSVVTLSKAGLKNFTYSISFLSSNNNFCNANNEKVDVTVKLVNKTVITSAGGYFSMSDSDRIKTITQIAPNEVRQVTFNNLNFAPNVETEFGLELVSIQGNRCRTDLLGNQQWVKINLSDSRIGQEIEYFIQNLTNGTYA
ncbi:MAG: hypothetical protein N3E37_06140, partial [Candidatus Micrarchaeota archaeon]|nr:hypothetical protein [Candidatus Micrarchaeota archaeon]